MKSRKLMATVALFLTAGFGVTACSSGDNASSNASSSAQQTQKELTDADKQKLDTFLDDLAKKIKGGPAELSENIKSLLEKLYNTKADDSDVSLEEASKLIEDNLSDQEQKDIIDYFEKQGGNPLADMTDYSDAGNGDSILYDYVWHRISTSAASSQVAVEEIKPDFSQAVYEGNTAFVPLRSSSDATSSATPSASADADALGVYLVYADGQWKIDAKKTLNDLFDKTTK